MDNPEKLATEGTQGEEKQSHNTIKYVLDTTICKPNKTKRGLEPSYKQLEVKTNLTPILCGNRTGHHNTELRT